MKVNLVKLSLIGIFATCSANALANPNSDKTQEEQEPIIYSEMESGICPYEPRCPEITQLEPEDDQ